MHCMLGLDVLEDGPGEAAVPSAGVRQTGLGAGLARHQHRRGAALQQRQHLYQQQYFISLTQIEAMQRLLTLLGSHLRPPPRHLPPHRSSTLVTAKPARLPSLCRWPSQSSDPGLDTASGPLRVCCRVEADILCDNGALTEGKLGSKGWACSDNFLGKDSCLESISCGCLSSVEQDKESPLVAMFLG